VTEKIVHIVCLDVPWPVNYGGVVDLFYKIKTLHNLGVKIHLHCFTKNDETQKELDKYCESVHYYIRKNNTSSLSFSIPLIVNTRQNNELINNLNKDNHPVLLEGIHCTYYLYTGALKNRKIIVRLHNAEFKYYKYLAKYETNLFKKIYFLNEARLLKNYENVIAKKAITLAVNEQDADIYKNLFGATQADFMPVFVPYKLAVCKEGRGTYCLYHGNLAINENEKAAIWLLKNVFANLQIPFVIAGKNPSKKLIDLAHNYQHTCLVQDLSEIEMQDLIAKAQIHILPSFNNTGVKLKLLNAVFNGRYVVVNNACLDGSGLDAACHIANDAATIKQKINQLYHQYFNDDEIQLRQGLLNKNYNNANSIKKITEVFWAGETFLNLNASVI
jgi:glycosyltransferase involved in cell wall biosynthesis